MKVRTVGPPVGFRRNPTWHAGTEAPGYGRESITVSRPPRKHTP
jgi:hypothetical protein